MAKSWEADKFSGVISRFGWKKHTQGSIISTLIAHNEGKQGIKRGRWKRSLS